MGWLKNYSINYASHKSRWQTMRIIWRWFDTNKERLERVDFDLQAEPRMMGVDVNNLLAVAIDGTDFQTYQASLCSPCFMSKEGVLA